MKKESSDCMFELKEGLIIAPNHLKKEILKNISKQKKLINIKIMTKEEFVKNYYGTYKKEALYFLMKNFNYRFNSSWDKLSEEQKAKVEKLHSCFMKNGIIADVFSIIGEPLNIL